MIDRSLAPQSSALNMEAILQNGGGGFKDYHRSSNGNGSPSPLGMQTNGGSSHNVSGRHSPPLKRSNNNSSPVSSPPSSPPRGSPLFGSAGNPPPFPPSLASGLPAGLPPGVFLPPNYLAAHHRAPEYLSLSAMAGDVSGHPYSRSPSYNMVSPNDPTANACKIVDFHGEKIASFNIHGKTMLCLPQAFELFLKNLVGGLHTVYTKCKRLDIHPLVCNVEQAFDIFLKLLVGGMHTVYSKCKTLNLHPIVCNTEQVRVLRGLGAIQPGVNRCKLIGDTDFEELMKDCNTSRPGRPPKRMTPITTFASMPPHHGGDIFNSIPRSIPFPPPPPSSRDIPPFHPFMSLSSQSQAHQLAAQSLLGRGPLSAPPLLQGDMLEKYGHMLRHLQGLKNDEDSIARSPSPLGAHPRNGGDTTPPTSPRSPALNLSYPSAESKDRRERDSKDSHSPHNDTDAEMLEDDISESSVDVERRDQRRSSLSTASHQQRLIADKISEAMDAAGRRNEDGGLAANGGQNPQNFIQLMSHIQDLVKTAITNAKDTPADVDKEEDDCVVKKVSTNNDNESLDDLKKQVTEAQKLTDLYLRRFKKEKRLRRRIQDQLEMESIKKAKLEEALSAVSYQTYIQLKDES